MFKKIKKNLVKFASLSVIPAIIPFISLSVDVGELDYKNEIKQMFLKAIDGAIERIEKLKLEETNNTEKIDFNVRFSNLFYYENLLLFLKANKENIASNPSEYGFNTIFFNNIFEKDNYNFSDIKFNDNEYKKVISLSNNDKNYDYNPFFKNNDSQTNVEVDKKNNIKNEEFKTILTRYGNKLIQEFFEIVFNKDDILIIKEEEILKFQTLKQDDGKEISTVVPNFFQESEINNFNEYIASKYQRRFIEFDIKQNFIDENEEQEKEEEKKEETEDKGELAPEFEEILQTNPSLKADVIDTEILTNVERLRILTPFVNPEHLSKSFVELKNSFNSYNGENKSENFFFFDNPILTKYKYEVTEINEISSDGNLLDLTIEIKDISDPLKNRKYKGKINKTNVSTNYQTIFKKSIDVIENIYLDIYDKLEIGKEMDFSKIFSGSLKNQLFNLIINSANNFYYENDKNETSTERFAEVKKLFFANYEKQFLKQNIISENEIRKFESDWKEFYINSLKAFKFEKENGLNFFNLLTFGFENDVMFYKKLLEKENENKLNEKLEKLFEINQKFDVNLINKLFNNLNKNIAIQKKHVISNSFNTNKWYEKYMNNLEKINKDFKIVSKLLNLSNIETSKLNEEDLKNLNNEFLELYTNALESTKIDKTNEKYFIFIFGILFTIIGLFLSAISLIKYNSKKIINKQNIIFIFSSISITILGIILIILKFIGGIF
ncbi:MSC_0620 family F1-like ATPase-associated subunit [[Mycoplasma] collis]|uniref:MSC_0620 family F1-like ATPase-associated subunit n=1 Tax=[Mycoplasma] collis TaxID=2127 RepID=UPI00051B7754|nr:hypothetical protein [[Mycoplasma] collis]